MTTASNKREFTRVIISNRVEVRAAETALANARVTNLSMSGILVSTQERLPMGAECKITVFLSEESGGLSIQAQGKVVRIDENGLAIEFLKLMGVDSYQNLRNVVLYNSPDPDRVEMEFQAHVGIRRRE